GLGEIAAVAGERVLLLAPSTDSCPPLDTFLKDAALALPQSGRGERRPRRCASRSPSPTSAAARRLEALPHRLRHVLQAAHRRQRRERLRLAVEELGEPPPAERELRHERGHLEVARRRR
ncbi:Os04g0583266, partial [Oryza sativa Japonica Group]